MKKDIPWILVLVLLAALAIMPLPKTKEKTQEQIKPSISSQTNPNKQTDSIDCTSTQDLADDHLSILTNQQNSEADSCLFLGCNGFF